jgi:RNA polymerase subunit RPABC4/transcription elongation factor Spt4
MSEINYWRCPECLSLVSNERTACDSCGVEIPERWS